jgi:hypothetical protein
MICSIRFALLAAAAASATGAQSPANADSLLRRGSLERAESEYYAAARVRPHDPGARSGLGRYVAGRGATKVGVTLLEEAMRFGGDSAVIGAELVPMYLHLWEYNALLKLPTRVVNAAERERARWLEAHPTRLVAPDSEVAVSYRASGDSGYLGRIPIRVNGKTVEALIAPTGGLVLSDSVAAATRVRRYATRPAARGSSTVAIGAADSMGVGRLSFMNLPIRVGASNSPAVIGLDLLGKLAPTFDPKVGRVTLRVSGAAPRGAPGDPFPVLVSAADLRLLQAGGWISVVQPPVSRLLVERSWTYDAKRGLIVLGR